jgi:energy-coupling factor transporter transmembrane protein EcfT
MSPIVVVLAILAFYLALIVVTIIAWVKIITKAGYSGWLVLLGFVPLVNFVMLLVFAFSKWPVTQRLEAAERANRAGPNNQYGRGAGGFGWGPVPTGRSATGWDPMPL